MCGIFAYSGNGDAAPILLQGLKRLEHRGYDSAGILVADTDGNYRHLKSSHYRRSVDDLESNLAQLADKGTYGIAHTRWATHGAVNMLNAHPHFCNKMGVAIVHNGVVENYLELKEDIAAHGDGWNSETDSEVLAHLIGGLMLDGCAFPESVRMAAMLIKGSNSFVAIANEFPGVIAAAKVGKAGGISVTGNNLETFISNDPSALVPHNKRMTFLGSGEMVVVDQNSVEYTDFEGKPISKRIVSMKSGSISKGKEGRDHFMAKEIYEQPAAVMDALRGRIDYPNGRIFPNDAPLDDITLKSISRVVIVAMGSSFHAASLAAKHIEKYARIPAVAENAAEFVYRDPVVNGDDLVIAVTQSGETTDTLTALDLAVSAGAHTLAVVENEASYAAHIAKGVLPIRAGQEIGVAATKTMVNTAVSLLLFAFGLASRRGAVSGDVEAEAARILRTLPDLMTLSLESTTPGLWADMMQNKEYILIIARAFQEPVSMEAALKIKEVAYIHAESYSAAEMKHGVNALITEDTPVIAIAPQDSVRSKMLNNISEVKARSGKTFAIVTKGEDKITQVADHVLEIPAAPPLIQPFLTLLPMQLMAYFISCLKGIDPDRPRNLAKTVTVE